MILDTAMGDTAIRNGILEGLAGLGSDYEMYGQSNVAVVGTHQHSGPGACKCFTFSRDMPLESQTYGISPNHDFFKS
jgi:hypothetical protein